MSSDPLSKELSATPSIATPAIALRDVWLGFSLRFHRKRLTLRGAAVSGLASLIARRRRRPKTESFWALRGVDLTVAHGEALGIVGPNGAGKTTLLRAISGIYAPDRGSVRTNGSISTLLSLSSGFDLRRPGRENIYRNAILLGMAKNEVDERVEAIIEMADLGDFIDAPVMTYSAGMRARLGFSIAVNVDPDILLIDEVVGAGDERFRRRAGTIFDHLRDRAGTIVIVTHNLSLLDQYCTRAAWLEAGQVRLAGSPSEVRKAYMAESEVERTSRDT